VHRAGLHSGAEADRSGAVTFGRRTVKDRKAKLVPVTRSQEV